jgi:hypothetical protein
MVDTEVGGVTRRRFGGRRGAAVLPAIAIALAASLASSAERPSPRVIWVRADRAYVALPEGARAEQGDSASFEDRGKRIAAGRVSEVVEGELAIVSVTSGSLARVKKLDRVRVLFAPPAIPARASLRIALPSNARDNLLFRCAEVVPGLPAGVPAYRTDRIDGRSLRLTREGPPAAAPWPDTLLVLLFDDPSDEEIALERGDVDVAVFWPGELSRRVREDARWHGFPMGNRSRGVLALTGADGVAAVAPDSSEAVAINDALFRGDLGPRGSGTERGALQNVEVDESLPGSAGIRSRIRKGAATTAVTMPGARLTFVDAPMDTAASPTFYPLFRVRCPVVCAAPLRPLVNALGADAFADMPRCRAGEEAGAR